VSVSVADFLWFVDDALDAMLDILRRLGDIRANTRPDLGGANSPFAILTHCLGVMEFWGGSMVAGRAVARDREAEFVAEGAVEELVRRTATARRQLEADLSELDPSAAPAGPVDPGDAAVPYGQTRGAVLLHILEELYQHLGQMQLSRDVLMSGE
jgi:DinB superfamily